MHRIIYPTFSPKFFSHLFLVLIPMLGQIYNLEELSLMMAIAVCAKGYQQSGESVTNSHIQHKQSKCQFAEYVLHI